MGLCFGLLVMPALNFKARVDPLTLSPACNGSLRFNCGMTPAELLVVSMVTKPFSINTCSHKYNHFWGLESGIKPATLLLLTQAVLVCNTRHCCWSFPSSHWVTDRSGL